MLQGAPIDIFKPRCVNSFESVSRIDTVRAMFAGHSTCNGSTYNTGGSFVLYLLITASQISVVPASLVITPRGIRSLVNCLLLKAVTTSPLSAWASVMIASDVACGVPVLQQCIFTGLLCCTAESSNARYSDKCHWLHPFSSRQLATQLCHSSTCRCNMQSCEISALFLIGTCTILDASRRRAGKSAEQSFHE